MSSERVGDLIRVDLRAARRCIDGTLQRMVWWQAAHGRFGSMRLQNVEGKLMVLSTLAKEADELLNDDVVQPVRSRTIEDVINYVWKDLDDPDTARSIAFEFGEAWEGPMDEPGGDVEIEWRRGPHDPG